MKKIALVILAFVVQSVTSYAYPWTTVHLTTHDDHMDVVLFQSHEHAAQNVTGSNLKILINRWIGKGHPRDYDNALETSYSIHPGESFQGVTDIFRSTSGLPEQLVSICKSGIPGRNTIMDFDSVTKTIKYDNRIIQLEFHPSSHDEGPYVSWLFLSFTSERIAQLYADPAQDVPAAGGGAAAAAAADTSN